MDTPPFCFSKHLSCLTPHLPLLLLNLSSLFSFSTLNLNQVDLRDLEDAAPLWHVDKLDLNMDTHRSFEARPRHASPSVRQQHLSLDIAPLPLKTHRPSHGPLMAEESADNKEGLIQMVYAIYPVLYVWDVDLPLNRLFSMSLSCAGGQSIA